MRQRPSYMASDNRTGPHVHVPQRGSISNTADGGTSSTGETADVVPRVPLDQDTNHQWAHLKSKREAHHWYIHRAPPNLRVGGNDERFEPVVVSIGPYHREQTNARKLKVSEDHKKQYLSELLSRGTSDEGMANITLTSMVKKIEEMEATIRACYSETIELERDDLVKMMILDGCFIIELFYKNIKMKLGEFKEIHTDDIFNNNWMIPSIFRDLVLLENQIPFAVLAALYEIAPKLPNPDINIPPNAPRQNFALHELIAKSLRSILPAGKKEIIISTDTGKHLLDILRTHLISQTGAGQPTVDMGYNRYWEHTARATDLQRVGVVFRRGDINKGLLDIYFKDGLFEIPSFYIGRYWSLLFANMIALEQCRRDYEDRITSYAFLLDNLIDSGSDVKVLRDCEIIKGSNEEDESIASIVNGLCKLAVYNKFYYDDLFRQVNVYRKRWHRPWRAAFIKNFFQIPWKGFSIVAAAILLAVALTQTIHDFF